MPSPCDCGLVPDRIWNRRDLLRIGSLGALGLSLGDVFAATDTESAQARHDIGQLLEALPDRHRLPILHVKLGGLSVSETARLTGMSESAVKVGIHRGLKALALKIRSAA